MQTPPRVPVVADTAWAIDYTDIFSRDTVAMRRFYAPPLTESLLAPAT
jgi:hypothetical protein